MNMNNGCREDNNCYCYFHPREVVIGVCPFCLNERLLILATTQRRRSTAAHQDIQTPVKFHRIFHFGSLLHRLEFRPWKSDHHDDHDHDHDASTSQEDSFISIKFEENGNASWEEKRKIENDKETQIVMEHGKPRGSSLRWRKRIGHVFHLIRWKRNNHVSNKVEGVKVRKGWIRSLSKKRSIE